MFPASTSVDGRLAEAVEALEAANPALRVLAARVYRVPFAKLRARVAVQHPRRFNILEEFVLRAAAELSPPPTPPELAVLLGLDLLFVESTLAQLERLQAVTYGPQAAVTLTPQGRQFAARGQVLQPAEHKSLSFLYRGAVDALLLWVPPPEAEGDLTVLPGVSVEARERLATQAQAALVLPRVVEAVAAGGLGLHAPAEGRLLTTVDQVAVEDLGFAACGVLLAQNSLTGQLSAHAIDLDTQASDRVLQQTLDGWLADGRVQLTDFLPAMELAGGAKEVEAAAEASEEVAAPEYIRRYHEQIASQAAGGQAAQVELLRAGHGASRAREIISTASHSALVLYPRLTAAAGEALRAELQALAARGVLSVVGWGTADDRDQEPEPPAPGVVEGLQRLHTPEGLPAATVWWVGSLYGQDVVLDHQTMVSSVPNVLALDDRRLPGGVSTYLVTAADLVGTALEDFEPPFARAARLSWRAAARSAMQARHALNRCCLTWVVIRRPGEALSHLLKLAAHLAEHEPAAMLVAWEALSVTLLGLARLPEAARRADASAAAGALDTLRRSIPEFLDWSDSVLTPGSAGQTPFVASLRELLGRHTSLDESGLDTVLAETQRLWREQGSPATGLPLSEAFIAASDSEPKRERLKKRRY